MTKETDYREWFLPGVAWWFAAPGFGAAMTLALWPLSPTVAVIGGIVMTALTVVLLMLWSPRIEVKAGTVHAGPAHIEAKWLGAGRELRGEDLRLAIGPELDARTWMCIRPWVKSAVIIENLDPDDPAPAWIVATRQPEELLQAVKKATD